MENLRDLDERTTEKLVQELDALSNELDSYKQSLKEYVDQNSTDMILTPLDESPQEVIPMMAVKENVDYSDKIKAMQHQIEDMSLQLGKLDEISRKLDMLEDMDEEIAGMKQLLEDKLKVDFEAMYRNMLDQMNVEAVKVYRNIQAVIVEEDAKQNSVLWGVDGKSNKLKHRMNHVMIVSIVSFVVSILVMLMQILPALGIKLF